MEKKYFIVIILIFNILLLSCSNEEKVDTTIVDNESVYLNDNFNEIKEIYITVLEPKKSDKKYNYTLSQINSVSLENREYEDGELKVIFQEGNNGELKSSYYGYGQSDYNATMKLRGQSARLSPLKSYKVSLNSKAPWNGYTTVNLNKHPFDDLRIRNKLTFELIKDIPNITSARTQFVHLFVKDFSEGDYTNDFVDYGLFTQIENIDKDYLENHNLDKKGYLYKIENFEFRRYNDVLLNVDDFDYDEDDFEEILEIKGEDNHEKLLNMLDDVNNYNININTVIEEHFDKENLLTWLALNIITDNIDTQSRNYFIYSPENSPTWYFLPWDYDKAMGGYDNSRAIWQSGISNYWGIILINRFLRNDQNYEDLKEKVEELRLIFNQEKIDTYVSEFEPIIYEYLTRNPDNSLESSLSNDELPQAINNLKNQVNNNVNNFYESIERPMPFFLGTPYINGNFIEFDWTESYDFQKDPIYYSIEISDTPDFENTIYKEINLKDNELIIQKLTPGRYYYKVLVYDINGNTSDAFDIFHDEVYTSYYYGVKEFYVY